MSSSSEWLRVLVIVLAGGNLVALGVGALLLFKPQLTIEWLGLRSKNPTSVRRLTKVLEKQRDIDTPMMRYARPLGVLLCAGALYVLIAWSLFVAPLSLADGGHVLARMFAASWPPVIAEWLWSVLLISVFLGAFLALAVGALAFVRADLLARMSKIANRWVSTRQAVKSVSQPYYGIDRLIAARPQVWGGVIAVLACYTLAMIFWSSRAF
jgi:hypothetical protein